MIFLYVIILGYMGSIVFIFFVVFDFEGVVDVARFLSFISSFVCEFFVFMCC